MASIIERMDLGYASNLMRVRVGLTAPLLSILTFQMTYTLQKAPSLIDPRLQPV